MSPREYANRLVVDLPEARTLTERVDAIARVIAEAVAEERESCAIVVDQVREQYRSPAYRTVLHIVSKKIRLRAGAVRRAS